VTQLALLWLAAAGTDSALVPLPEPVPPEPTFPDSGAAAAEAVLVPVLFDSLEVFVVAAEDSATAVAEAARVQEVLRRLRDEAAAGAPLGVREREGIGLVLLDSVGVLELGPPNRPDPELSPLANALVLRDAVVRAAKTPASWNEEELLLRLLLGIVYPFSLLVVLRLVRTGLRRWERNWRRAARTWVAEVAQRRGTPQWERQGARLIDLATGLERFAAFGLAVSFLSFGWFALFPQTQHLALSFLAGVLGPIFAVAGSAARAGLLLLYSASVLGLAVALSRALARRRRGGGSPLLRDPVAYLPLQAALWITAVFLLLFPYPGAPRLFAVGVLLLALLATVLATRPLAEEIAAGMLVNGKHGLRVDDVLVLDGVPYRVIEPGLVQIHLLRDGAECWMPYSRILRGELHVSPRSAK
jgi:hypothetical protein